MSRALISVVVVGLLAMSGRVEAGQPAPAPAAASATSISDEFVRLCRANPKFHVCEADRRGESIPAKLKRFTLSEACSVPLSSRPSNCVEIARLLAGVDASAVDGTLLSYDHLHDRWRAQSLGEYLEPDANGIYTVYRRGKQDLAVIVDHTNPLLYEARAGEVKETDIPLVADLKAFASVLSGGITQAVAIAGRRTATAAAELSKGVPDGFSPTASITKSTPSNGHQPAPPPPQPPPCEKECALNNQEATQELLRALAEKRAVWLKLRTAAEWLGDGVRLLEDARLNEVRLIQAVELQSTDLAPSSPFTPPPTRDPSLPPWTAERVVDSRAWDEAFERLVSSIDAASTFGAGYAPLFDAYLALVSNAAKDAAGDKEIDEQIVLGAARFYLDVDRTICPAGNCTGTLAALRSRLTKSVTCLHCLAGLTPADAKRLKAADTLAARLRHQSGLFSAGLTGLMANDDERKAITALLDVVRAKKDHLKVLTAIQQARARTESYVLNGRLVDWTYVAPKSDKFSWDKEGSHEVEVAAASAFADQVVKERRDVKTSYKVRSYLSTAFGVSTGFVYTKLRQTTWALVCRQKEGDTCVSQAAQVTGSDSRSGQLGMFFDVHPSDFFSAGAQAWGFKPIVSVGAGLTGDLPALYLGGGFELGKRLRFLRLTTGATWQKFDKLNGIDEVQPNAAFTPLEGTVPTRSVFTPGWYVSAALAIDALSLFSK